MYHKQTFIRENFTLPITWNELVCSNTFSRQDLINTSVVIKQMTRTGSQQEIFAMTSLSEFLKNFLHANNSWFTVIISTLLSLLITFNFYRAWLYFSLLNRFFDVNTSSLHFFLRPTMWYVSYSKWFAF